MNSIVFRVVRNSMFVIIPLPVAATHWVVCGVPFALHAARNGHFVGTDDCPDGTAFRSVWCRGGGLCRGGLCRGGPLGRPDGWRRFRRQPIFVNDNNPMHMI